MAIIGILDLFDAGNEDLSSNLVARVLAAVEDS